MSTSTSTDEQETATAATNERGAERRWRIAIGLLFAATRALMLVRLRPNPDVQRYFSAAEATVRGLRPYADHALEYPPGALLLFLIPRLLTRDLQTYTYLYAALMLVFDLLNLLLLWRVPRVVLGPGHRIDRKRRRGTYLTLAAYLILTGLLGDLVVLRHDLALATVVLAFALRVLRGGTRRLWIADLLLAVGIWIKLVPVVLLLPYLLYLYHRELMEQEGIDPPREWGDDLFGWLTTSGGARRVSWIVVFVLVLTLPFVAVSGSAVFDLFSYHAGRGLQVESSYASLLILAGGLLSLEKMAARQEFGAWHLHHRAVPPVAFASTWIAVLTHLLAVLWLRNRLLAQRTVEGRRLVMLRGFLVVLLVLMISSKVFSPQFLLWIAPIAALLAGVLREGHASCLLLALAVNGLTTVVRLCYRGLLRLELLPAALLVTRNALVVWLIVCLARDRKRAPSDGIDHGE